jgi:hypothetical protein
LYYKGSYLQEEKFSKKLKIISNILKDEYVYDSFFNVCHIQLKSYFLFNHLYFIKSNCNIIFIPEYSNDKYYQTLIKFPIDEKKNIRDNDIREFWIRKTEMVDIYNLYNMNKEFYNIACVPSLKLSLYLKKIVKNDDIKMKCRYNKFFESWIPIQL